MMLNLLTCCLGHGRKTAPRSHDGCHAMEKELMIEEPYSDISSIGSRFNSTTFDVNFGHVVSVQAQLKRQAQDYADMSDAEREEFERITLYSWRESLAKRFLETVQAAITAGVPLTDFLNNAFIIARIEAARIVEIAKDFAGEHPILTGTACAVVALGVLYLTWPEILPLLGFGELGPIEGSFAAFWQSLYGDVPYGSLFAYLQRLGMLLGK